jgi:hypothetical protein
VLTPTCTNRRFTGSPPQSGLRTDGGPRHAASADCPARRSLGYPRHCPGTNETEMVANRDRCVLRYSSINGHFHCCGPLAEQTAVPQPRGCVVFNLPIGLFDPQMVANPYAVSYGHAATAHGSSQGGKLRGRALGGSLCEVGLFWETEAVTTRKRPAVLHLRPLTPTTNLLPHTPANPRRVAGTMGQYGYVIVCLCNACASSPPHLG